MKTSIFFLVWGLWTALALPLLLLFRTRSVAGIRAFIFANILASVSLLAYATDGFLPQELYVFVSSIAWVGAVSAVCVGIRQFFGLPPNIKHTFTAAACAVALLTLSVFAVQNELIRLSVFS
ncbi:GGDEF domain-containing protein, partial [Achromobacter anxifer]|nr:GGDEF domain-containing protein [Achromobacter anxifer]